MNEISTLFLAGFAGLLLGAFFFGGLWWSLHKALNSNRAALWQITSLLVRMGVSLLGFYLVGGGQWQRLMACLAGFVIARMLILRMTADLAPPLIALAESSDLSNASASSKASAQVAQSAIAQASAQVAQSAIAQASASSKGGQNAA